MKLPISFSIRLYNLPEMVSGAMNNMNYGQQQMKIIKRHFYLNNQNLSVTHSMMARSHDLSRSIRIPEI